MAEAEPGSETARKFVSSWSLAINSGYGRVWRGGLDESGIGTRGGQTRQFLLRRFIAPRLSLG